MPSSHEVATPEGVCSRRPIGSSIHPAGGTHHDRRHHPSYDRRALPDSRGRRPRGRGHPAACGCGDQTDKGSDSGSDSSSSSSSAPLADKLPSDIRKAGVIKVGSDIAYPPVEFMKDGKATGIDPDIADALGKQLGVKFQFQNGKFDQLIVGLQAGRTQVIMSAMNDTKDRQNGIDSDNGKKAYDGIDFVDYFTMRHLDPRPEGQPQGHQDPGRPVRQGRRPAARHHLRGRRQGAEQEVQGGRQEGHHAADLRHRPRGAAPSEAGRLRRRSQRLPRRGLQRQDLRRRQGLRGHRRPDRGGPVRHRRRQEEHPAARRAPGGRGRHHQERRVQEDPREVERHGRRRHRGQDQRWLLSLGAETTRAKGSHP